MSIFQTTKPETKQQIKTYLADEKLKNAFKTAAFLSVAISFASEMLGVFPFLLDVSTTLFDSARTAKMVSFSLAVFLCFSLEYLVYHLITFLVEAVHAKYYKPISDNRTDKAFQLFKFVSATLLLIFFVAVSMTVSKQNVKFQLDTHTTETVNHSAELNANLAAEKRQVLDDLSSDKTEATQTLDNTKNILSNKYSARLAQLEESLLQVERKQVRTGNSYYTRLAEIRKQTANVQEQKSIEMQAAQEKYDSSILAINNSRDKQYKKLEEDTTTLLAERTKEATNKAAAKKKRNAWLSSMLMYIAMFSSIIFVVARIWIVASECTSGLKKEIKLPSENFNSSVLSELYFLMTRFPARKIQNLIRGGIEKIPDLRQIEATFLTSSNVQLAKNLHTDSDTITATVKHKKADQKKKKKRTRKTAGETDQNKPRTEDRTETSTDTTNSGVSAHSVPIFGTEDFTESADIEKANRANDRNKNKHIKREKKRIKKFVLDYQKRYKKKPSYDLISEATSINKRSVGRFVREMKNDGDLLG